VLIRRPADAALSLTIHSPFVSLEQALRTYERFYRRLLPYREALIVADFPQTTGDFGAVIERVNLTFGRSFGVFEHRAENVERCFRTIDERNRQRFSGSVDERAVARPSSARAEIAAELRKKLEEPRTSAALQSCCRLHELFAGTTAETTGRAEGE
jgi:hypothetical protein